MPSQSLEAAEAALKTHFQKLDTIATNLRSTTTPTTSPASTGDKYWECPICFEPLTTANEAALATCGHMFHDSSDCLRQLLRSGPAACPVCRESITETIRLYNGVPADTSTLHPCATVVDSATQATTAAEIRYRENLAKLVSLLSKKLRDATNGGNLSAHVSCSESVAQRETRRNTSSDTARHSRRTRLDLSTMRQSLRTQLRPRQGLRHTQRVRRRVNWLRLAVAIFALLFVFYCFLAAVAGFATMARNILRRHPLQLEAANASSDRPFLKVLVPGKERFVDVDDVIGVLSELMQLTNSKHNGKCSSYDFPNEKTRSHNPVSWNKEGNCANSGGTSYIARWRFCNLSQQNYEGKGTRKGDPVKSNSLVLGVFVNALTGVFHGALFAIAWLLEMIFKAIIFIFLTALKVVFYLLSYSTDAVRVLMIWLYYLVKHIILAFISAIAFVMIRIAILLSWIWWLFTRLMSLQMSVPVPLVAAIIMARYYRKNGGSRSYHRRFGRR